MDIRLLRGWMYDRVNTANRTLKEEFKSGVYGFIDHVRSQPGLVSSTDEIRCPCWKCRNRKYIKCEVVIVHLCKWGFKDDYWYWTSHGELEPAWNNNYVEASSGGHFFHKEGNNRHKDLVHNALNEKFSSDEFRTKSRKAKQNRAADSAESISNFSGAKNRMRLEDESRKKLCRDPQQDEVFFAQYAKKNADGELQEWANRKAETLNTGYMESVSSQASNSNGEELSFPPLKDQLKIWAETQDVSKKGTVYGLSCRASQVRPTRSTHTSNTAATDPKILERLSTLETQLASVLNSVETMKERHKVEIEMQKMIYTSLLSATLQNQGGTSQSSQPFFNFTNHLIFQHQAGTSQSSMIYSHFSQILGPNTFPKCFLISRTADPQPSQHPSQSQHPAQQVGSEPSWPPLEDQLKIWAEIQGVSKNGTIYELSRQASQVRPTRSASTSNTPAADHEQLSEILTELASVKDSVEMLKENHKAELEMQRETYLKEMEMQSTRQREMYLKEMEMQRMMFANFLATTVQSQGGTSQSSQQIVSQHQAGTSQSGMVYSHFPGILAPNTFPMFFNVPPAADQQPSQAPSQSQPPAQQGHENDTCVPETQDN